MCKMLFHYHYLSFSVVPHAGHTARLTLQVLAVLQSSSAISIRSRQILYGSGVAIAAGLYGGVTYCCGGGDSTACGFAGTGMGWIGATLSSAGVGCCGCICAWAAGTTTGDIGKPGMLSVMLMLFVLLLVFTLVLVFVLVLTTVAAALYRLD